MMHDDSLYSASSYPPDRGQGLVEYALVLVLVALVVIVIVAVFGAGVGNLFSRVTSQVP